MAKPKAEPEFEDPLAALLDTLDEADLELEDPLAALLDIVDEAKAERHARPKLADQAQVGLGGSAHEIWLAGLGALAQSQADGSRLFTRLVGRGREVKRRGGGGGPKAFSMAGLQRVQRIFDLDRGALGRLFGVSRQAVSSWLAEGVPSARLPKLVTILEIADLLSRQLKPGRLPGVARKPARAYGGLSLLEMVEADRHEKVLELVRRSFDWAATA